MSGVGDVVTVTDAAAARARELLARSGATGLRVTVQSSGCDGFVALLDLAEAARPDEIEVEDNGVRLYVDVPSMLRLPGATLDHTTTRYGNEFTWDHPGCAPAQHTHTEETA
jgi:iron-sulfur cluster assembly accessory protein